PCQPRYLHSCKRRPPAQQPSSSFASSSPLPLPLPSSLSLSLSLSLSANAGVDNPVPSTAPVPAVPRNPRRDKTDSRDGEPLEPCKNLLQGRISFGSMVSSFSCVAFRR